MELTKKKIGINNLNTLRHIANEIPSFDYNARSIGGQGVKSAYGPRGGFIDFLTAEVRDI